MKRTQFSLADLTVHYAAQKWWATAASLYQFDGDGPAPGVNNSRGKNFDEHERWHIGLSFGWEFGEEADHDYDLFL